MDDKTVILEVILPVHNEEGCIEAVLDEIDKEISKQVPYRFILCEDGSTDNTKQILKDLSTRLPMVLMLADERKGYSKAVCDGMKAATAPFILCLDSDGQCDPKDFWKFWELHEDFNVLIGWRTKRADSNWRILFSRVFHLIYKIFFKVPVHDPSCPFLLASREVIQTIDKEMGAMQQGFWWEFTARVYRHGYKIKELPISHRERLAGKTQVYRLNKIFGIGVRHFLALFKIYRETATKTLHEKE